ncbi:hypothetical protein EDC04DRAFT_2600106 [Pisolithus marmoratus]|nr:hypothetical protein EDC04DRAFT_2600106 [Pisolithus marmoratus]
MQEDEANKYSRYMAKYWDAMVAHAEREWDSTIYVPRDENTCLIKNSMPIKPIKLKALHHGVDKFANQFPVPTKVLVYTLGEQLRSIEPVIREVVFGLDQRPPMWQDHLRAMEHFMATKLQKGLALRIYKYIFSMQQSNFLGVNNYIGLAPSSSVSTVDGLGSGQEKA